MIYASQEKKNLTLEISGFRDLPDSLDEFSVAAGTVPRKDSEGDTLRQYLQTNFFRSRPSKPCRRAGVCYIAAVAWIDRMPAAFDPDAALMLRVKQGDTVAFTELVNKYRQPVMNLAYRTLRDASEAEDLAQNVFVQVYKSAHRYRTSAKFSTWLFTIARNLCLNELRRRSRHPAESIHAKHPEHEDQPLRQFEDKTSHSPTESLLHGELEEKIEKALAELPENQRTAILLCRQEELSYEEIAKVLGCSLSATKSLIHRGREVLKEKLKPYLRSGVWRELK